MEMSVHGPLSRAFTTSVGQPTKMHSAGHVSSWSVHSQPTLRPAEVTQPAAQSALFPAPSMSGPPAPGLANTSTTSNSAPIEASNNVMNKVAEKETSLFQICVSLRLRLQGLPGFDSYLLQEEQAADDDMDPVTLLWKTFRRGSPLLAMYNVLRPDTAIVPDLSSISNEFKRGKAMTFKFLRACIDTLGFKVEDCFILNDLYGDDTTGFVKVTKMVTRLLDLLVDQHLIEDTRRLSTQTYATSAGGKRSQRQHIVDELVSTERTYVQQLELLQAFKQQCESTGVIPGDVIHQIFLNLNALLDFQRRFLIRVEQINALPEEEQNWGKLFILYGDSFNIYEPYITNQKLCEETVVREFDKLKAAGGSMELQGIVANPPTLYSFLMKPFQRLSKYPLLLEQLYKHGDLNNSRKDDLLKAKECAIAVLSSTNAAMEREDNIEAVQELKNRVEDWKGHRVEGFGDLLLYGTFTVVKSDAGAAKDPEREYHVYFFESILLCCKDIDPSKAKNKMRGKPLVDKRGKPKLQLKGRIFMQNVTDVLKTSKAGSYTCQIFWKGDPGIENFTIRFAGEDIMAKWYTVLLEQKKTWTESARSSDPLRQAGTSMTEFIYMQNQGDLENPHRQEDEEEEEQIVSPGFSAISSPSSRNASGSSLRSRFAGAEGAPPSGFSRAMPPRFAAGSMPLPSLSLRTRDLQNAVAAPADRVLESYFSPTVETPIGSGFPRTSTSGSGGMYPFPRQAAPTNGYYEAGHERYTAPVMGRSASRESANGQNSYPQNTYPQNARGTAQRPPLPLGPYSAQQLTSSRNRSASSPSIDEARRRLMNSARPPVPDLPLPPYPSQYLPGAIGAPPRSQNGSPHSNGLPSKAESQSPQSSREQSQTRVPRDGPSSFGYDGTATARVDSRFTPLSNTRSTTPVPYGTREQLMSPPLLFTTPSTSFDISQPTQLKVKVHAPTAGQVLTLVVPLNISFQSLKDRIDAKLQRSTNISLGDRGANQVKLKYLDEDDLVSIQSDEDVQIAFETWREQRGEGINGMGEIELYCQ